MTCQGQESQLHYQIRELLRAEMEVISGSERWIV